MAGAQKVSALPRRADFETQSHGLVGSSAEDPGYLVGTWYHVTLRVFT